MATVYRLHRKCQYGALGQDISDTASFRWVYSVRAEALVLFLSAPTCRRRPSAHFDILSIALKVRTPLNTGASSSAHFFVQRVSP